MNADERWRGVNELFDELVELPRDARRARFETYVGDASILAEVQSLLDALEREDVAIEGSASSSHVRLMGALAVLPMTLVGRRLGPWAVVREIGRGGMGAVYEAYRADDLYQKRVAVKTLTRGADSDVVARRFQQERQILASLDHPNIATLIDGGMTAEGLPYLVMEYVDGQPIDSYCTAHRVSLRDRLDLFRKVSAAVQFAHRNLVVHRDLKPSNILVTADGDVKLVDFGIAKLLGPGAHGEITQTETGVRAFTTGYASPEQVRGATISTSTDVYSLAATLFRLLTGRLPFDASGLTPTEALRRITDEPPPAPSRVCTANAAAEMGFVTREALARALSGELDDILLTGLRKEPERRYQAVAAFSDDIKRYLQGQQVSARPDTWRYRVRAFSRRNPRLVGTAAVALLSLGMGATVATWQAIRAGEERDRARAEARRSSRVLSFVEEMLSTPVQAALTEQTIRTLDQALDRTRTELHDDPLARAAVYRTAAKVYAYHNRVGQATPLIDSALVLDRRHVGEKSVEVGRDLIVRARIGYSKGNLDSAVVDAARAVEILQRSPSDRADDLPTARLYHSFALTYAGRPDEGLSVARVGLANEAERGHTALLAYLHMAKGEAHYFAGRFEEGRREYARAIEVYSSLPGPQPVERGIAELGLATAVLDVGRLDEASTRAQHALQIFEQHWGAEHAFAGRAHATLARVAAYRNDLPTAFREIDAAKQALNQSQLGLVDWITIEASLAQAMFAAGEREQAVERLRNAVQARQDELSRSPQILSFLEELLGHGLVSLRRAEEARVAFDSSYVRRHRAYGAQHMMTQAVARNLVFLAGAFGDSSSVARFGDLFPRDSVDAMWQRGVRWRAEGR